MYLVLGAPLSRVGPIDGAATSRDLCSRLNGNEHWWHSTINTPTATYLSNFCQSLAREHIHVEYDATYAAFLRTSETAAKWRKCDLWLLWGVCLSVGEGSMCGYNHSANAATAHG